MKDVLKKLILIWILILGLFSLSFSVNEVTVYKIKDEKKEFLIKLDDSNILSYRLVDKNGNPISGFSYFYYDGDPYYKGNYLFYNGSKKIDRFFAIKGETNIKLISGDLVISLTNPNNYDLKDFQVKIFLTRAVNGDQVFDFYDDFSSKGGILTLTGVSGGAYKVPFILSSPKYTVETKVYPYFTDGYLAGIQIVDNASDLNRNGFHIFFDDNDGSYTNGLYIRTASSSSSDHLLQSFTASANKWYILRADYISYNQQRGVLYDNDYNILAQGTYNFQLTTNSKYINLDVWKKNNNNYKTDFDWVRVRKYTGQEPTVTVNGDQIVINSKDNLQEFQVKIPINHIVYDIITENGSSIPFCFEHSNGECDNKANDIKAIWIKANLTEGKNIFRIKDIQQNFVILDENGNKVNYCFEQSNGECNKNPSNVIWVKVPFIPANGNTELKIKISNTNGAVNGDKVFDFYDDFTSKNYNVIRGSSSQVSIINNTWLRIDSTTGYSNQNDIIVELNKPTSLKGNLIVEGGVFPEKPDEWIGFLLVSNGNGYACGWYGWGGSKGSIEEWNGWDHNILAGEIPHTLKKDRAQILRWDKVGGTISIWDTDLSKVLGSGSSSQYNSFDRVAVRLYKGAIWLVDWIRVRKYADKEVKITIRRESNVDIQEFLPYLVGYQVMEAKLKLRDVIINPNLPAYLNNQSVISINPEVETENIDVYTTKININNKEYVNQTVFHASKLKDGNYTIQNISVESIIEGFKLYDSLEVSKWFVVDKTPPQIILQVKEPETEKFYTQKPKIDFTIKANEDYLDYCELNGKHISTPHNNHISIELGLNNVDLRVVCYDKAKNRAKKNFSDSFYLYYFSVKDEKTLDKINLSSYDELVMNIIGLSLKSYNFKEYNKTETYFLTRQHYNYSYVKAVQYGATFTRHLLLRENNTFLIPNIFRDTINKVTFTLQDPQKCYKDGYLRVEKIIEGDTHKIDEQGFNLGEVKGYLIQGEPYFVSLVKDSNVKMFGIYTPEGNDLVTLRVTQCDIVNNLKPLSDYINYSVELSGGLFSFILRSSKNIDLHLELKGKDLDYSVDQENITQYELKLRTNSSVVYVNGFIRDGDQVIFINKIVGENSGSLFPYFNDTFYKVLASLIVLATLGLGMATDFYLFLALSLLELIFFSVIGWVTLPITIGLLVGLVLILLINKR